MIAAASFLASRDFLIANRADYEGARKGFVWPRMPDFNWALDYFDPMAAGNERPALWIVEESGESFACRSRRSPLVPTRSRTGFARKACGAVIGCCSCSATKPRYGKSCSRQSSWVSC